jgi:hypothetical protein
LPDTVTKQFRIRSIIRTMVNKMGDVNLSDLFRALATVVLMLVNVMTVRGATRAEVLLRFVSDFKVSRRSVASFHNAFLFHSPTPGRC